VKLARGFGSPRDVCRGILLGLAGDQAAHYEFREDRERQVRRQMKEADNVTWVT
jgi:hypothetical protein